MSKDIYLYIKNQLINSNFTDDNLLIKTPSVSFQLTTMDYQKNNNLNLSTIDLGACEDKLREEYNISKEYDLIFMNPKIKNNLININIKLLFIKNIKKIAFINL